MEKEMKRFADYGPTAEEIVWIFGTEEDYGFWLEVNAERRPLNDSEKYRIAQLLSYRDQDDEARKVIESIEDEDYRETCLEVLESWLFEKSFPEGVPIPFAEFVS